MFNLTAILNLVGANTAGVRGAINQVQNKLNAGTASAKTFSDAVALKGIQLAAYGAAGAAVIKLTESISRATSDAIRFEYELAKIAQTVNKTNAEIGGHADSIRKISVAYGLSAPKIAETIRVLAQAGYSFKEAKASADSLAQTTLLASFESIADTTDGLIAINKQFVETMGDSARVLAILNNVSKKYAVESSDLVEAVRKAGGVFSATGGKMEELVAIFTTVRDTTRESAETIATGLRTIFSRLQRPKTIEYMRQFGIELTDLKGNFIGNYEAIKRIQKGIADQGLTPKSTIFAGIVEEIGGIRQQARVIPLLTQANKLQQVYQDTQTAGVDTALDLAKAQETLSFKIAATQQNFARFISEVSSTDSFKSLINGLLGLTNAAINFASALKDLIPLITLMLAFKVGKSLSSRIFGGATGERKIPGFARGGFVPGTGSGDTVPAMLEPGEFVVRKSAAMAMGGSVLHRINRYASGGTVTASVKRSGQALKDLYPSLKDLDPTAEYEANVYKHALPEKRGPQSAMPSITAKAINAMIRSKKQLMWQKFEEGVLAAYPTIGPIAGGNSPLDYPANPGDAKFLEDGKRYGGGDDGKGNTPETMLGKLVASGLYTKGEGVHVYYPENPSQIAAIVKQGKIISESGKAAQKAKRVKQLASGGSVGTDTVPALLTPGEFVVNKASAQAVGYGNLNKINKYAAGGRVGVQKFAAGGIVGGALAGADGLIGLLGDIGPAVLQFGASLASAQIQLSLAGQVGTSIGSIFKQVKVNLEEELAARNAFNKQYNEQTAATGNALAAQVEAQEALSGVLRSKAAPGVAAPIAQNIRDNAQGSRATRVANKFANVSASGASASVQEIAGRELAKTFDEQANRIRSLGLATSEETAILNGLAQVQIKLKDDNVSALTATAQYTDEMINTRLTYEDLEEAAQKNVAAAKDLAETQVKLSDKYEKEEAARNATPQTGFKAGAKRFGASLKQQGPELATKAVALGVAGFTTYLKLASDAAQKLSDKAIEAGNSAEAYNQSLAASSAAAEAEAIQTGATAGAAIGALFGPFGPAIGGAIGAIVGWTGGITYMTDLLGFTNSALDAELKAREQERQAAVSASSKIISEASKQAALFEQTDPDKAAAIMAKGVQDHLKNVSSNRSITNSGDKDTQELNSSLFNNLSQRVSALAQANGDKLYADLASISPASAQLVAEFEALGSQIKHGTDAVKSQAAIIDSTNKERIREKRAIEDSIALELRQNAIRTSIQRSLVSFDSSITEKSRQLAHLSFASGGSTQIGKPTNLNDLSVRNVNSTGFITTLNNLSKLGPEYAEQVNKVRGVTAALGSNFTDKITAFRNAPAKEKETELTKIGEYLEQFSLDPEAITAATDDIRKGKSPLEVQNELRTKELQSAVEDLQSANETLREDAEYRIKVNEALSKAEEDRLSKMIEGTKTQAEFDKKIRSIATSRLDPSRINQANYNAGRNNRLSTADNLLDGTALAGRQLTGGGQDITAIGQRLAITKELDTALQDQIFAARADVEEQNRLIDKQKSLRDESTRLEKAMSALADTTEENEALQAQITQSQERRSQIRDTALEFAGSNRAGKRQFVKTAFEANVVANTRNIGSVPQKDLANVFAFLQKNKGSQVGNSGLTGQEVLNNAVKQIAIQTGSSLTAAEDLVAELSPIEAQALEQLKKNLDKDIERNTILNNILFALENKPIPPAINPVRNALQGAFSFSRQALGLAAGGSIFKPRGTDTVPAMLTPGEFVMSRSAVKRVGVDNLHAMNSGTNYLAGGGVSKRITARRGKREELNLKLQNIQQQRRAIENGEGTPRDRIQILIKERKLQLQIQTLDRQLNRFRGRPDRPDRVEFVQPTLSSVTGGVLGGATNNTNGQELFPGQARLERNRKLFASRAKQSADAKEKRDAYYTPEGIAARAGEKDKNGFTKAQREANRAALRNERGSEEDKNGKTRADREKDRARARIANESARQARQERRAASSPPAERRAASSPPDAISSPTNSIEQYKQELQAERDKEAGDRANKEQSRRIAAQADLDSIAQTGFPVSGPPIVEEEVDIRSSPLTKYGPTRAKRIKAAEDEAIQNRAFQAGQAAVAARGKLPYQESLIGQARRENNNFVKQQEYERSGVFKRPFGFNKGEEGKKEAFKGTVGFFDTRDRIADPRLSEDTPVNLARKFELLNEHRESGGSLGLFGGKRNALLEFASPTRRTGTVIPAAPVLDNGPAGKTNDEVARELGLKAKQARESQRSSIKNGGPTFEEALKYEQDKILFGLAEGRETARLIKEGKDNGGGTGYNSQSKNRVTSYDTFAKFQVVERGLQAASDKYRGDNKRIAELPGKDTFFGIPHPKDLQRGNPISTILSNRYENSKVPYASRMSSGDTQFNTGVGSRLKKESEKVFKYKPRTREEIDDISAANKEKLRKKINAQTRGYANGGDVVPAMLTPGEFVMNKRAVDNHGSLIRRLNEGGSVQGFANGGFVGGKTAYLKDGGFAAGNLPSLKDLDFSSIGDSIKQVLASNDFLSAMKKMIDMPKTFDISLASEGININLNGADFLAKIPDIIKVVTMETITNQMGAITESVKTNLASGR